MGPVAESTLKSQLLHRRDRLMAAMARHGEVEDLLLLLREVDGALDRIAGGTFGICEVCHETIDEKDLLVNPLMRYCLCDLSANQQRALEDDLALASRIQAGLLPEQDLKRDGWEAHYRYEPAGVVSGDYCDVLTPSGSDCIYFAIGDVSGKGVAASLLMAQLNASFRILAEASPAVTELVNRANRLLLESTLPSHYATLICGRASATGTVELCNAGHVLPFLLRAAGEAPVPVASSGPPIGLFKEASYGAVTLQAEPGDALYLYTDGLTESRDPSGREYGMDRLAGSLRAARRETATARTLGGESLEDLTRFLGESPRTDDLTILVVSRNR